MRRWLPALAFDRPVTVLVFFVALLVLGTLAWFRVPLQLMPDGLEQSQLFVRLANPGGTPRETDEQVVGPAYAQLATIPGLKTIRSSAGADSASFNLSFDSSVNGDDAYNSVVDRMERALVDMPDGVDRYFIFKFNIADAPVLFAGVTIPDSVEDPYYLLTRVVQPRIERVPGVAAVDVRGVPQRNVYIEFDRERIVAHAVDVGEVQRRLQADNFQMAAGRLTERGQLRFVRSISNIDEVQTLQRYPVRPGLMLQDIATVQMRSAMSADVGRLNGMRAAVVLVRKESAANLVDVTRRIEASIEDLNTDPRMEGAELLPFFNQGDLVLEGMNNLLWTAVTGGIFAVIVLFMFLREWRMTLLIAASIPFSLLITIGVLYFNGDTLNLLSLMGLMLAVGMVVDNAIVAVETIYRRRAEGLSVREAAVEGTAEVNLAIVMSTATSMVVFLPLILMAGDATFAVFLGALGLPVVFALAASLLVALIFAPLATRYIGAAQVKADPRWLQWLSDRYAAALGWVLRQRFRAFQMLVAVLLLGLFPLSQTECTVVDEDSQNQFELTVSVPPQADPNDRSRIIASVEELLDANREEWGIDAYYAELGASDSQGDIDVWMISDPPLTRTEVMEAVRDKLPQDQAGVTWSVGYASQGGGKNKIDLTIRGEDVETLLALGEESARRIKNMPGVIGARVDESNNGLDELRMQLNRDALDRYGLSGQQVAGTVSFYLRGTGLEPLRIDGREVDVVNRFELDDRDDLASVLDSPIFSPTVGRLVPLRALTSVETAKGPGTIRRFDNRTGVKVSMDLAEGMSPKEGFALAKAALSDMSFPRGYGWERGGQAADLDADFTDQLFVIGMSICFVFLLMGVLFESWLLPISILVSLPLATIGCGWMWWTTGTPFDLMGGIGLVILVGVVVNNGIVLIDLVTQLRSEGIERTEALVEAGRRRLRPILMTALTTICGLLPMALGDSAFAGIPYAPLGLTVIGGLAAATLLTLVFVPFLYAGLDDLRIWTGRVLRRGRGRSVQEAVDA
ncbi:MAG: efflux RND transporter permease subunit [Myxococcota bacterium]